MNVLASNWGYVTVAWAIAVVVLATYALRLALRGRALSRLVPPERRRWMDSGNEARR